jgi:hypothetical protein
MQNDFNDEYVLVPKEKLTEALRVIRDTAWQFGRQHQQFSTIERLAEESLALVGVVDGPPYPNPRPRGWWRTDAERVHRGD